MDVTGVIVKQAHGQAHHEPGLWHNLVALRMTSALAGLMWKCWGQADAGAGVDRRGMLRASARNKLAGVGAKPRFLQGSVDEVSFLGARA